MKRRLVFAVIACAACAAPSVAQDRRGVVWDDRPSIVFGEDINVDLKGRVQFDGRWFDPQVDEEAFEVRTLRFGLKGDLTRHFDWEIEREIEELFDEGVTEDQIDLGVVQPRWRLAEWKDVYINWSTFDAIRIKAGRFKMPFGLEQNTSVSDLDFAYRTAGSVKIAPGRDRGVMAYGELLGGSLLYEGGVFDDDGDNGELEAERFLLEGEDLEGLGPSYAARVIVEPFRRTPIRRLRGAEVGVAYTRAYVPEGLNSIQGEDVWGYNFFDRVYVKGRRQRIGLQWDWSPGPTGFRAEWMQSREQRLGQSNRNEDLSDFIGTAWYTSATWILTGEDKDSDVPPERPLFRGGLGLFEIGARYDQLSFSSANTAGTAFRNPRSDVLLPNSVRTVTFGGNWLPVRWVKVVANAIRQSYEDVERTPAVVGSETFGPTVFWSGLLRLQIAF
jgi:phosphate-selective porin OprO/OprP